MRRPVTDRTQEVGLACVLVWRTFWSLLLLITSLWQGSAFIHPVKFGSQWKYPSSVLLPFSGSGTCGGLGFRQNMHTHTSTPGFYLFTRSDQTVCRPFVSAVFAGMCVQQITHLVVTLQVVILTYLKQIEFSFCLENVHSSQFLFCLCGVFFSQFWRLLLRLLWNVYMTWGNYFLLYKNLAFTYKFRFSPPFCCIFFDFGGS